MTGGRKIEGLGVESSLASISGATASLAAIR